MLTPLKELINVEDSEINIFEAYQNSHIVECLEQKGEVIILMENGSFMEIFDSPESSYQYNILSENATINLDTLEIDYDNFLLDGGVMTEGLGAFLTIEKLIC